MADKLTYWYAIIQKSTEEIVLKVDSSDLYKHPLHVDRSHDQDADVMPFSHSYLTKHMRQ